MNRVTFGLVVAALSAGAVAYPGAQ